LLFCKCQLRRPQRTQSVWLLLRRLPKLPVPLPHLPILQAASGPHGARGAQERRVSYNVRLAHD